MVAKHEKDKARWVAALRGAIAAARASGDAAAAGAGADDGVRAPLWFPRHGSAACQVCEQPFSARALRWRHHCRRCGRLACGACVGKRAVLAHIDPEKASPVCLECFAAVSAAGR